MTIRMPECSCLLRGTGFAEDSTADQSTLMPDLSVRGFEESRFLVGNRYLWETTSRYRQSVTCTL